MNTVNNTKMELFHERGSQAEPMMSPRSRRIHRPKVINSRLERFPEKWWHDVSVRIIASMEVEVRCGVGSGWLSGMRISNVASIPKWSENENLCPRTRSVNATLVSLHESTGLSLPIT